MVATPDRSGRRRWTTGRTVVAVVSVALLVLATSSCSSGHSSAASRTTASGLQRTSTTRTSTPPRGGPSDPTASAGCRHQPGPTDLTAPSPGNGVVETITVDGTDRQYLLAFPAPRAGHPAPLVLAFHGFAGNPADFAVTTDLPAKAVARGYVVALPAAVGGSWRLVAPDDHTPAAADVDLTRALVRALEAEFCIDTHRVFAAGFSSGSAFTGTVACALPGTFAAIGLVSAEFHFHECDGSVSVMAFHGDHDPVVPYDDGTGLTAPGVHLPGAITSMDGWAANEGCRPQPTVATLSSQVVRRTWGGCRRGLGVVLHTVLGGSHAWPGDPATVALKLTTDQIDATTTILDFFGHHPRA